MLLMLSMYHTINKLIGRGGLGNIYGRLAHHNTDLTYIIYEKVSLATREKHGIHKHTIINIGVPAVTCG